jgi:PadR family transcriptional regulator PadR
MGKSGHLGELEQMVLLAILRLGDEAYGGRIRRELEERAERGVARGALYVTIDRLVEKGMLESRMGDSTPGRGGRRRRYLTLTPAGKTAVQRSKRAWIRLWEDLDGLVEGP